MLSETTSMNSLPPEQVGENLAACHRCPRRQPACAGACACLEDGEDIIGHAGGGRCPLGRYRALPPRGLGDVVANVARRVGGEAVAMVFQRVTGRECGCRERQERLNRLVPFRNAGAGETPKAE